VNPSFTRPRASADLRADSMRAVVSLRRRGQMVVNVKREKPTGIMERFVLHEHSGCWNWTGTCSRNRGMKKYKGKNRFVSRVVAHLWLGFDLDSHLCVLHRCDNPCCINPKHLFFGTQLDNAHDRDAKGRHASRRITHCPSGHPYSAENTYYTGKRRGCFICRRRRSAEWNQSQSGRS